MSRITSGLHIVEGVFLKYPSGMRKPLNVCLIFDSDGLTIVDTGMPGSINTIEDYLKGVGHSIRDLRRIFLTHLDNDHIGSALELKEASGAEVMMHQEDAQLALDKTCDEHKVRSRYPNYKGNEVEALLQKIRSINNIDLRVDRFLKDGERLDIGGKSVVVHTPGHTPGHCCLFIQREDAVICGDALSTSDGEVSDPTPEFTVRLEEARRSILRLQTFTFERLIPYHNEPLLKSASNAVANYSRLS